jgi:hypothetical protein
MPVPFGRDPTALDSVGWGIVFEQEADPAVREALEPLIAHRQRQAASGEDLFREFAGSDGYRPGESGRDFQARHGVTPGIIDPRRIPYYLLIVGSPESVPWQLQQSLGVQFAVGRLHFDSVEEYAAYARSVIQVEATSQAARSRVELFAVVNPDDPVTAAMQTTLVEPLTHGLREWYGEAAVSLLTGPDATKDGLADLLRRAGSRRLLFLAGHGVGFPAGDPLQESDQGALLCADWPGPQAWRGAIPPDLYFAARDVPEDATTLGSITLIFASYGAGTPKTDEFAKVRSIVRSVSVAPRPFVAGLARRLLGNPKGGGSAVIGLAERAWGFSALWPEAGGVQLMSDILYGLLDGTPVGRAMRLLSGERYAQLAVEFMHTQEELSFGKTREGHLAVSGLWAAMTDAKNFVVLGDPAVRLPNDGEDHRRGSHTPH